MLFCLTYAQNQPIPTRLPSPPTATRARPHPRRGSAITDTHDNYTLNLMDCHLQHTQHVLTIDYLSALSVLGPVAPLLLNSDTRRARLLHTSLSRPARRPIYLSDNMTPWVCLYQNILPDGCYALSASLLCRCLGLILSISPSRASSSFSRVSPVDHFRRRKNIDKHVILSYLSLLMVLDPCHRSILCSQKSVLDAS